jgi:hypothetical protein
MREFRAGFTRVAAGAIALLATPLVYLISVPLVWRTSLQYPGLVRDEAVNAYGKPYYWLALNTPWGDPLVRYSEKCLPGSIAQAFIISERDKRGFYH